MKWVRSGILIVLLIATAKAAPTALADEDSLRLPKSSVPISYDLTLTTNVHTGASAFSGIVKINILINVATDFITLHNRGLRIGSVKLTNFAGTDIEIDVEEDQAREFLFIEAKTIILQVGSRYTIEIAFDGFLQGGTSGFYRSSYRVGTETRYLAATQFESTNARYAFPCYDEPSFKATFKLTIIHGSSYNAISNTNGVTTDHENGMSTTTFDETPRMSSYLLAFLVSDFTYTTNAFGLPEGETLHRIYARTADVGRTQYALDNSVTLLKVLEAYVDVTYEIPKMWSAAIPDFGAGAMENWGLITYKEQYLIGDPNSHPRDVLEILKTIAHELGHQFFGNLVTCEWWDQIWLNEGFATLFEYLLVEKDYPNLRMRDYFNVQKVQNALRVDALETTRAMLSNAETPSEISNLFDRIAYDKSGSVIRMFQNAVGETVFKAALKQYLTANQYETVTSDSLYSAFATAISQIGPVGFSFTTAFRNWETTKGFPLIKVTANEGTNTFRVTQERYYAFTEERVEGDTRRWYVPLNYATASNPNFDITAFTNWIVDTQNTTQIILPVGFDSSQWFIFNKQQFGFYRVNYDNNNWNKIIEVLNSDNFEQIHVLNRAQLVDDALNLAMDGYLEYNIAFGVLKYLSRETDYIPWRAAVTNLDKLDYMLAGRPGYENFGKFVKFLVRRLYVTQGMEEKGWDDTLMDKFAREVAIDWTCRMGDAKCLADTWAYVKKSVDEDTEIPDSLEITYICNGLKGTNRQNEFAALWRRMQNSEDQAKRLRYIDGLICSHDYQALWDLLESTIGIGRDYRTHERQRIFNNLYLKSSVGLNVTIDFISQYYPEVSSYYSKAAVDSLILAMSRRISVFEEQEKLTELMDKLEGELGAGVKLAAIKNIDDNKVWLTTDKYLTAVDFLDVHQKTLEEVENVLRLPKTSVPLGYKIHIDARTVHTGALPFTGEVEIDALIVESTSHIIMHSKTQIIDEIKVYNKNGMTEIPVLRHNLFPAVDTLTIYFLEPLAANTGIIVNIKYSTNLLTFGSGFYRTSYTMNGTTRYVTSTQFQPAHGRYAFPHYDEPGFKVPFDLKITHDSSFRAIANTFGTDETNADGTITTTFLTTPPMSSYLLAFVVSDFEYISNEVSKGPDDTLHRIWVRPDSVLKAPYALEHSEKVLKSLEEYLSFGFELPKVDSAAIPNKGGAMENWGMVTYWETAMIFEEDYNDISHGFKFTGVSIIAHELAHQFFGNSLTCEWWDVTWLNEGFATLFEFQIPEILYPQWNARHFFNIRKLHNALRFDAGSTTRPMTFPVATLGDISTSFNTIGYDKSGSILRMFQFVVGETVFKNALNFYLETHNYQAVRAQDLIDSFKAVHAGDFFDFEAAFKSWELQAGFPLVTVSVTSSGQFNVTQQRFFATKPETSTDTSSWYIPLNFATAANPNFDDTSITNYFVNGDSSFTFEFDGSAWFVFNKQQLGYYRVNYDAANWQALISVLNSDNFNQIHVLNRVQLVDDSITLAAGGYLDYETVFGILTYLVRETEYTPFFSADRFISTLYTTFGPFNDDLTTFVRHLTTKFYDAHKVPSNNQIPPAEDVYERYNRDLALKLACNSGNEQCLTDTGNQMRRWTTQDLPVPKGLETNIYCNGLKGTGKQDVWVAIWRKMTATTDATFKTQLINALGCSSDPVALKDYLESTLGAGNSVSYTQANRRSVLSAVLNSPAGLEAVINFYKDFELNIMSSFGYSLENLLNVAAVTVKTREQQVMFYDYLLTLTHLSDDAFRRISNAASSSIQNQLQRQNADFLEKIKTINIGFAQETTQTPGVTSTPTISQPSTQPSTGATDPTGVEGTSTTAAPTTLGAASIGIKLITLVACVFVAFTLKF